MHCPVSAFIHIHFEKKAGSLLLLTEAMNQPEAMFFLIECLSKT